MATGMLLLLLGIWIIINTLNGNFGGVLSGKYKLGTVTGSAATATMNGITPTNTTSAPQTTG